MSLVRVWRNQAITWTSIDWMPWLYMVLMSYWNKPMFPLHVFNVNIKWLVLPDSSE